MESRSAQYILWSDNPYRQLIRGGWFDPKDREHHTGAVYLNGHWLDEADGIDKMFDPPEASPLWFGHVDRRNTTIFAHFRGVNPNEQTVEINVRWAVFYPEKPHCNYITVRGFTMQQAATQWAPPRTEQVGLIGTHWSKGWIIEDNVISHSRCTGITLGKHGDEWDNNSKVSIFIEYARRAHARGWNRDTIGSHVVRNNTISHCEQSGIVGSLGAVFSEITGNTIHDIHVRRLFTGHEMAGIKLHAGIDVEISGNRIYRADRGIWLDWMTQGTRVTGNLLHDNGPREDLFIEVSHGPYLIDNNLFLSDRSLADWSQGGAYVHNLFAGSITRRPDKRVTPYHLGPLDRNRGHERHRRRRQSLPQQPLCRRRGAETRSERIRQQRTAVADGRQCVSQRSGTLRQGSESSGACRDGPRSHAG
jgi:alpha-L-arabinofuranosidase